MPTTQSVKCLHSTDGYCGICASDLQLKHRRAEYALNVLRDHAKKSADRVLQLEVQVELGAGNLKRAIDANLHLYSELAKVKAESENLADELGRYAQALNHVKVKLAESTSRSGNPWQATLEMVEQTLGVKS